MNSASLPLPSSMGGHPMASRGAAARWIGGGGFHFYRRKESMSLLGQTGPSGLATWAGFNGNEGNQIGPKERDGPKTRKAAGNCFFQF
jgi:hypothetical protein